MDKKEFVRRYVEAIYNRGELESVEEFISSDYVNHTAVQTVSGVEGVQAFVQMMRQAFPDLHETLLAQISEGDFEVHHWKMSGTHTAEFLGIPATNRKMEMTGMTLARFENGKIAEEWSQSDTLGMMQQLGVIPALVG